MTPDLHIIGIDPGGTTGWCRLTVPRKAIFGKEPSEITEWDYGEFNGLETQQALDIARLARETQGLAYRVGPALIIEQWDQDPRFKSTDPEALSPVRIGAMLCLLKHIQNLRGQLENIVTSWLGDATLTFQGRQMAFSTATDDRLRAWGMYHKNSEHIRAATRHAITALRRAKQSKDFATQLWPSAS